MADDKKKAAAKPAKGGAPAKGAAPKDAGKAEAKADTKKAQAQGKGRGEHLNEERFHVFDETLGRPPLITIIQEGELTVEILRRPGKIFCEPGR